MKIYQLIHEQDTDAICGSGVMAFADRPAARGAMRKQWAEAVKAWEYDSKGHGGDDECKCREDAAVVRCGGDVEHWRIEEQELNVTVSVVVEVSGGLVRNVYAKGGDVDVDVLDLDAPDEDDEDDAKAREATLDECVNAPGWQRAW